MHSVRQGPEIGQLFSQDNCALSGFSEWNAKQEQQVQQYRPNGSSKIMKPKQKQV